MRKVLPVVSLLVAYAASRLIAGDADNLFIPHITVFGTAVTEVRPDRLNWVLEVKNTGLELPKVAEMHAKKIASVLEEIKGIGIPDKEVQTAQMEFAENMVYRRNENVKEGYYASTIVSFKLSDFRVNDLTDSSETTLGQDSRRGIRFLARVGAHGGPLKAHSPTTLPSIRCTTTKPWIQGSAGLDPSTDDAEALMLGARTVLSA